MYDSATTLQIFDLDETLFRMPGFTSKKQVEKNGTFFDTPYSFYDHPLSLCEDAHHIQIIDAVYSFWKENFGKEAVVSVLITHRVKELEPQITRILQKRNIFFDKLFFLGRKTQKTEALDELLQKLTNIDEVRIFEDSIEQLFLYQEYSTQLNKKRADSGKLEIDFKLYIVDKSKMFRIEHFKLSEKTRIQLI